MSAVDDGGSRDAVFGALVDVLDSVSSARAVLDALDARYALRAAPAAAEPAAPATDAEPVAFVIPGSENARDDGAMDAWAWQRGEFSMPVYTAAQLAAAQARGRASADKRIAALREALLRCASRNYTESGPAAYDTRGCALAALAADDAVAGK